MFGGGKCAVLGALGGFVSGGGACGGGREAGLGGMDDGAVDGVDGAEACGDEDDVSAEARLGGEGAGFFAGQSRAVPAMS